LKDDPWDESIAAYQVGQLVEGKITRLTKFGAFAQIDDNLEGLVHISELSDRRIEHPKEVISEGEEITLRIIKIDADRRRIGLSLRKVESQQYSEMDWQMALNELDGVSVAEDDEEETEAAAETEVEETVEAEAEEVVVEEETEEEAVAEAEVEEVVVEEETEEEAVAEAEVEEVVAEEEDDDDDEEEEEDDDDDDDEDEEEDED
jgi:small subunit ribosomal protein S1